MSGQDDMGDDKAPKRMVDVIWSACRFLWTKSSETPSLDSGSHLNIDPPDEYVWDMTKPLPDLLSAATEAAYRGSQESWIQMIDHLVYKIDWETGLALPVECRQCAVSIRALWTKLKSSLLAPPRFMNRYHWGRRVNSERRALDLAIEAFYQRLKECGRLRIEKSKMVTERKQKAKNRWQIVVQFLLTLIALFLGAFLRL